MCILTCFNLFLLVNCTFSVMAKAPLMDFKGTLFSCRLSSLHGRFQECEESQMCRLGFVLPKFDLIIKTNYKAWIRVLSGISTCSRKRCILWNSLTWRLLQHLCHYWLWRIVPDILFLLFLLGLLFSKTVNLLLGCISHTPMSPNRCER